MTEFITDPTLQAVIAMAVVLAMFAAFVSEAYPAEVIAIGGAAVLLGLGVLPYQDALVVFSNPAPWTIAAMFIIMGGLVRTGALDGFSAMVERKAQGNPVKVLGALLVFVVIASAFVSNTPVVVVMIPVFVQLAGTLGVAPSRLLIPLSYVAIMGGTLTLIGTSTNLLVDGVARAGGMEPFGIFEVTPLGLIVIVWGALYLRLAGPILLPERASMAALLGAGRKKKRFFTEVAVPEGSALIGQNAATADMFRRNGMRVIDVLRGDQSLRRSLRDAVLQQGDRVVLRTDMAEVLGLQQNPDLRSVDKLSSVQTTTVEALISPGCRMVGRALGSLRLRRRYGVYPLAVHRRNQNIGDRLDDLVVRVGDTLLLEGAPEDIARLAAEMEMVDIVQPRARAYRRRHAPIVVASLVLLVVLAAIGAAPILVLALIAMALILLTRCIDADEAFGFIDGRLLALIFAMLTVGAALQSSGAVALIADAAAPVLQTLPPWALVWAIYLLTSILTELVSNNAVAVVVTPLAMGIAASLGVDPRPLVVAVMVAASASFATPIGYQTNMLVYGPGGYRFTDFMKIGIPLNLSLGLVASLAIPLIWPL